MDQEYESMSQTLNSNVVVEYEDPTLSGKLDQILHLVSNINTKINNFESIATKVSRTSTIDSPSKTSLSRSNSNISVRDMPTRPLPPTPLKDVIITSPTENRYSRSPRLVPDLPPRSCPAVPQSTQSPPLPPRDAPLPPTNNITHRDNTLSRNECRQAIGWLNEVKAFIYDNFDSDEVGVDENIERIENVEKIFCRQR